MILSKMRSEIKIARQKLAKKIHLKTLFAAAYALGVLLYVSPIAHAEAPPWKQEIAKGYFPYHRLVATDFPINDKVHPEFGMFTQAFFHLHYRFSGLEQNGHVTDRITEWVVWSGFDRNKSSRKSGLKLIDFGLRHEQGHLDINELYSRRLAKTPFDKLPVGYGATPEAAASDLKRKLDELSKRVSGDAQREQDLYDAATGHGGNPLKQREWSDAISVRLQRAGIHF